MKIQKLHIVSFVFLAVVVLAGCTKRDLLRRPDEAYLRIVLDWGAYNKPTSTGYHFYDSKGGECVYYDGTTDGFEGYVPAETYKVVIFNTDCSTAKVQNNNDYESDSFVANPKTTRDGSDFIENVDNVYGEGAMEIVVPRFSADPIVRVVKPVNFVRKITYILNPGTLSGIESLRVIQTGAVVDKSITKRQSLSRSTSSVTGEGVYNAGEGTYTASVSAMGFLDSCILTAIVTFEDGVTEKTIPFDLSDELVNFPEEDKTFLLTLQFENGDEIKVNVNLHGWKKGGSGGGVIE